MKDVYDYSGSKLNISGFATPEMYGAVGDGVADDTVAIQKAVQDKRLLFGAGRKYKITTVVVVDEGTVIDMNGSTLICTYKQSFFNFHNGDSYGGYNGNGNITIRNGTIIGGAIGFIHGKHIRLENLIFQNTLKDHFIEICACRDFRVKDCMFIGMQNMTGRALEYINIDTNASYAAFPHNSSHQSDATFYDMATNADITIQDCYFAPGDGDYAYGYNAIGVHSRNVDNTYADGVALINNTIKGFTGCGLRINAMRKAYIAGNNIMADGDGIRVGDVADCDDVVIVNNYVESENGQKLAVTDGQCPNLTVAGNAAKGERQEF